MRSAASVNGANKYWYGWQSGVDPNDRYTNPLTITMNADKEIATRFECGSGAEPFLPVMLAMLAVTAMVRRRG